MRPRYPGVLSEFEDTLSKRVANGEIKEITKETYLKDANRVFEAALRCLSQEALEALTEKWFGGSYDHVIKELKKIADSRERDSK